MQRTLKTLALIACSALLSERPAAAVQVDDPSTVVEAQRGQDTTRGGANGQRGNTPSQRGGGTPPQRQRGGDDARKRGGDTPPQRGGDDARKRGGDTPPQRGGDDARKRGGDTPPQRGDDDAKRRQRDDLSKETTDTEAMRVIAQELSTHRNRMARANQLLAIAKRKQDRARVVEIEALIARENKRHGDMMAKGKSSLGAERFQRLLNAVEKNKQQGGGDTPPERGGGDTPPQRRGGDTPPERGGGDTPPQRRGGDTPPQRGGGGSN